MDDPRLDRELVAALADLPEPPLDLEGARRSNLELTPRVSGRGQAVGRVEDHEIPTAAGSIPARLYVPDTGRATPPLVVYLHGGGWSMGSIASYDPLCRALANAAEAAVLCVEYRLAPEEPFPEPLRDCWAGVRWAREHAVGLGCDPTRIALAGDSAGGNLAVACALRARDRGGPDLAFLLLVYPALDPRRDTASYEEFGGPEYGLPDEGMEQSWNDYAGGHPLDDPEIAPARAASLAGLPPTFLVTAQLDPLRDEGEAFAARLAQEGVPVDTHRVDGVIHGFWRYLAISRLARETVERAGTALHEALA
jgi:acetyl esterase